MVCVLNVTFGGFDANSWASDLQSSSQTSLLYDIALPSGNLEKVSQLIQKLQTIWIK